MRRVLTSVAGCVLALGVVACAGPGEGAPTVYPTAAALITAMANAAAAQQDATLKIVKPYRVMADDVFVGAVRLADDGAEFSLGDAQSGGKAAGFRLVDGVGYELIPPSSATKDMVGRLRCDHLTDSATDSAPVSLA